jgi:hypothetical protein
MNVRLTIYKKLGQAHRARLHLQQYDDVVVEGQKQQMKRRTSSRKREYRRTMDDIVISKVVVAMAKAAPSYPRMQGAGGEFG